MSDKIERRESLIGPVGIKRLVSKLERGAVRGEPVKLTSTEAEYLLTVIGSPVRGDP